MIETLCGYRTDLLRTIPAADRRRFVLANVWTVAGIVLGSVAVALLLHGLGSGWVITVAVTSFSVAAMLLLQAHVVASVNVGWLDADYDPHRIHRGHVLLAAAFGLLLMPLTQPFLPFVLPRGSAAEANVAPHVLSALLTREDALMRIGEIRRELARKAEALRLVEASSNPRRQTERQEGPAARGTVPVLPDRKALLIGNGGYSSLPELEGLAQNVDALAQTLQRLGFAVTALRDASRIQMEAALARHVQGLNPGDVSLFYYSGHGLRMRGTNYLAPVEFTPQPVMLIPDAQSLTLVTQAIASRKPLASIVVVDAVSEPNASHPGGDLAPMPQVESTWLAVSMSPSPTSSGGPLHAAGGSHGRFTRALVQTIAQPIDAGGALESASRQALAAGSGGQRISIVDGLRMPLMLARTDHVSRAGMPPRGNADVERARDEGARADCDGPGFSVGLDGSGSSIQRQRCLQAKIFALKDAFADGQRELADVEKRSTEALQAVSRPDASQALSGYRAIWARPFVALPVTLTLWVLMFGGFLMRVREYAIHDAYSAALREEQIAALWNDAQSAFSAASRFESAPDAAFLKRRIFARLGTAAAPVQAGSLDDLMETLAPETTVAEGSAA